MQAFGPRNVRIRPHVASALSRVQLQSGWTAEAAAHRQTRRRSQQCCRLLGALRTTAAAHSSSGDQTQVYLKVVILTERRPAPYPTSTQRVTEVLINGQPCCQTAAETCRSVPAQQTNTAHLGLQKVLHAGSLTAQRAETKADLAVIPARSGVPPMDLQFRAPRPQQPALRNFEKHTFRCNLKHMTDKKYQTGPP